MNQTKHNSLNYHLLQGLGFLLLIGWFWLMREVAFMDWLTAFGPASHRGALNMLAIMIWMLPAFLLWKYYLRWVHRRLDVRGIYYEDHYYNSPPDTPPPHEASEASTSLPADAPQDAQSKPDSQTKDPRTDDSGRTF